MGRFRGEVERKREGGGKALEARRGETMEAGREGSVTVTATVYGGRDIIRSINYDVPTMSTYTILTRVKGGTF